LQSLYKKQEEAIEKLKKENATLKGMVQSYDELIMEIAAETGLDRMGEDNSDDEDDDDGDEGDVVAPPIATPELVVEDEEEDLEMMVLEQEAPEALEIWASCNLCQCIKLG
jgi:hypothetical protein